MYVCIVFTLLQLLCLAILIAAAVAISAINDLDDYAGEYRHANDYRGAAGWLVFVAIVAIIYHGFMIFIRILYFTPIIDSFFSGYSFAVSVCNVCACIYMHAYIALCVCVCVCVCVHVYVCILFVCYVVV